MPSSFAAAKSDVAALTAIQFHPLMPDHLPWPGIFFVHNPEVTMCITNEVVFRNTHRSREFFNPDVEINHARPS